MYLIYVYNFCTQTKHVQYGQGFARQKLRGMYNNRCSLTIDIYVTLLGQQIVLVHFVWKMVILLSRHTYTVLEWLFF